jgi:spore coat polysaccharide biosynthesis protein SpsF
MTVGAIIQARMTSKRLPGKVLNNVQEKPLLQYLIERLSRAKYLTNIVVATSDDQSDTPVIEFCSQIGMPCFRGLLTNVANRFYQVINSYHFDAFIRVSGDSPFLDQRLIDTGIELFLSQGFDIVTNVLRRTYPKGQSVEILQSDIFFEGFKKMKDERDLEHVTSYFYRNKDNYRIYNFESGENLGNIQLSVDTQEDIDRCEKILSVMNKPHWEYGYKDVVQILEKQR